ncbi:ATP-binding protein [Pseudomonas sp. PSKL.D1]|uniref:ATP-binding protein n=1 Tax=Pseudomonas sp. PSKL.D1 TaxID=3029060 RepID=UPI0023811274|nr:ATP-binding protein [Pseudomonas sp. PSKL.D1]WDY60499.1 ATP-binding protein [Pseudomonas sp. PSKL.D1]
MMTSAQRSPAALQPGMSDIELLHSISVALIGEQDRQMLYRHIIDAAATITGSQFATMQVLCPPDDPSGHAGELQLLCSRGLSADAEAFWKWVNQNALSSCGLALRQGKRAVIADFEQWSDIAGTPELQAFRDAGIRAAQTTPLVSRTGRLLGMMSNHWCEPHQPSERVLRLLDILARTAADLLERTLAEEALRSREQALERACNELRATEGRLQELNDTLEQRVATRTHELMAVEERLRQSQKMEAVGQLTGGLAHDFNNLLGSISGSLELACHRLAEGQLAEVDKHLAVCQGNVSRAATLTHRLLAFSRRQALSPRAVDVMTVLEGMSELIAPTLGPAIDVRILGNQALWQAYVDAAQLENALLNLCNNARDAMPSGGQITLKASNVAVDAQSPQATDLLPGHYVHLRVIDTGIGMPPETASHAFEPFFTTKPAGQGTGLGLSMIYGFAQQSGGHVESGQGDHSRPLSASLPCASQPIAHRIGRNCHG